MSWLSEWLHPGNRYQAAQDQYNQYYNQGQGYLNEYNKNLMDPAALRDKWEKGYKESDAAKNAEGSAMQHGLDAASSLGLNGSSSALQGIQAGTAGIAAQDKQNYLNDLMQKYQLGTGVAGQMSNNAMNMGDRSGAAAFGQHGAGGDMFGGLLGGGLSTLLQYLTGGMGTGSWGRGAWGGGK